MKQLNSTLLGFVLILGLITFNWWLFGAWLDKNYWQWYMNTGKFIGLGLSVTSMVWGKMGDHPGLIAKNPLAYLGAYAQLVGLPIYAVGTHLRSVNDADIFDRLVTILMALLITAALMVYLVSIVPIQYFIFLLVGAPARAFNRSSMMVAARFVGTQLEIKDVKRGDQMESGWWQASAAEEPVELTGLLSSLFLTILEVVLG